METNFVPVVMKYARGEPINPKLNQEFLMLQKDVNVLTTVIIINYRFHFFSCFYDGGIAIVNLICYINMFFLDFFFFQ